MDNVKAFMFDVFIKDDTNIKGFYVDKIVGTCFANVVSYYESRSIPILCIKCVNPVKIC